MISRVRKLALLCATLLIFAGAHSAIYAQEAKSLTLDLSTAISGKYVEASFKGSGASSGDSIVGTFNKTAKAGPRPLTITVKPGTPLRSNTASAQSMVLAGIKGISSGDSTYIPATEILLEDNKPVIYIFEAYCMEFHKDNPSDSVGFALGTHDSALACILEKAKQDSLSESATQAAVWIRTDKIRKVDLTGKFEVSESEWEQAMAIIKRC